jgi:hypothetical protein
MTNEDAYTFQDRVLKRLLDTYSDFAFMIYVCIGPLSGMGKFVRAATCPAGCAHCLRSTLKCEGVDLGCDLVVEFRRYSSSACLIA